MEDGRWLRRIEERSAPWCGGIDDPDDRMTSAATRDDRRAGVHEGDGRTTIDREVWLAPEHDAKPREPRSDARLRIRGRLRRSRDEEERCCVRIAEVRRLRAHLRVVHLAEFIRERTEDIERTGPCGEE